MKRGVMWLVCLSLSGLFVGGCSTAPEAEVVAMGSCPTCDKEMAMSDFCSTCTTVATTGETFECKKQEGKVVKAGTYCSKTNSFRFQETFVCKGCDNTVKKGAYCGKEKVYRALPAVAYCENCKKPYAKAEGRCPRCGK